mmetsp:Transcript_21390/g.37674  ORF Transcript_21390/g.37674 Transcript_21390/m.37674 type:complete len:135 (-) Transcript_21390:351-755(-)
MGIICGGTCFLDCNSGPAVGRACPGIRTDRAGRSAKGSCTFCGDSSDLYGVDELCAWLTGDISFKEDATPTFKEDPIPASDGAGLPGRDFGLAAWNRSSRNRRLGACSANALRKRCVHSSYPLGDEFVVELCFA